MPPEKRKIGQDYESDVPEAESQKGRYEDDQEEALDTTSDVDAQLQAMQQDSRSPSPVDVDRASQRLFFPANIGPFDSTIKRPVPTKAGTIVGSPPPPIVLSHNQEKASFAPINPALRTVEQRLDDAPIPEPQQIKIEAEKSKVILVKESPIIESDARGIPRIASLNFEINTQRSDTGLAGNSQGDHVTSHVAILRAMLAKTDGNNIEDAIEEVSSFAKSTLKDEQLARFKTIEKPKIPTREEEIIAHKAILQQLDPDSADRFMASQQIGKATILAKHLSELSSCFLTEMQKQELTTIYSQGRIKDAAEGAKAKAASQSLVALDHICKVCNTQDDEKFKQEIVLLKRNLEPLTKEAGARGETREDRVVKYGIDAFQKTCGSNPASDAEKNSNILLRDLNRAGENVAALRQTLTQFRDQQLQHTPKIAECSGALFDYNQKITFNLAETAEKDVAKNFAGADFVLKKGTIQIDATKQISAIEVERKNTQSLVDVAEKHVNVTKSAFPNLCSHLERSRAPEAHKQASASHAPSKNAFDNVVDHFLEKEVTQKQGWSSQINSRDLKTQITEKQDLKSQLRDLDDSRSKAIDERKR